MTELKTLRAHGEVAFIYVVDQIETSSASNPLAADGCN